MDVFPWLWFLFLVWVTVDFGLAVNLRHRRLVARLSADDDVKISDAAKAAIHDALVHWRKAKNRRDEHWDSAFTVLGEVLNTEGHYGVQRYMRTLPDDAMALFRTYERENYA